MCVYVAKQNYYYQIYKVIGVVIPPTSPKMHTLCPYEFTQVFIQASNIEVFFLVVLRIVRGWEVEMNSFTMVTYTTTATDKPWSKKSVTEWNGERVFRTK